MTSDPAGADEAGLAAVPDWDDEYLDRVSDRLLTSFDLERDHRVRGESFTLYGHLRMESHKQFFHPALSYGNHESGEHLFVRRTDVADRATVEGFVDLGHALAGDIEADEEHFSTDFTFIVVAEELADDAAAFVEGFHDRTLLKYGYYGHYEVNLVVVVPDDERLVASRNADVATAFRLWEPVEPDSKGVLARVAGLFG